MTPKSQIWVSSMNNKLKYKKRGTFFKWNELSLGNAMPTDGLDFSSLGSCPNALLIHPDLDALVWSPLADYGLAQS